MSVELALTETCPHPEMNMQDDLLRGRVYWCSACHKKIIIPNFSSGLQSQEHLAGIIGLAFGEKWGQAARKGQV